MGGACDTCRRQEKCIQVFGARPAERDHLEDLRRDWKITSKWILKKWEGDIGRIYLAQNRGKWQALVDAVKTFGFHNMLGISSLGNEVFASQIDFVTWNQLGSHLVSWLVLLVWLFQLLGCLVLCCFDWLVGWLVSQLVGQMVVWLVEEMQNYPP